MGGHRVSALRLLLGPSGLVRHAYIYSIGALRSCLRWALIFVLCLGIGFAVLLDVYARFNPPSTLMLSHKLSHEVVKQDWVSLNQISPALIGAVVLSEDGQFCQHHGVDWTALGEVMGDEDGPTRGASTIAMQTAKNLFLWPSRSYVRKFIEIPLALAMDAVWSKARMLEIYLNIAEWGPGIFGAEAAARYHFGIPASALNADQAALLATALPSPMKRNPAHPRPGHRRMAATIRAHLPEASTYLRCLLPNKEG